MSIFSVIAKANILVWLKRKQSGDIIEPQKEGETYSFRN